MSFSTEKQHERMWPHALRLINQLTPKGINFQTDDGHNNVVFFNHEREIKISHHSFYRYSGIACVYRDTQFTFKKKVVKATVPVEVTDEMYMERFMKPVVEAMFFADSALKQKAPAI